MKGLNSTEIRSALAELGVNYVEREIVEQLEKGKLTHVCVKSDAIGRCFERCTFLTFNGTEENVPKGNFGNHRILERGEHAALGAWIKSSCEYDSSD
jgi:hypothetical protein